MEHKYKYTVAGHTFCVKLPEGVSPDTHLKPYEPFAEAGAVEPFVMSLPERYANASMMRHLISGSSMLKAEASVSVFHIRRRIRIVS